MGRPAGKKVNTVSVCFKPEIYAKMNDYCEARGCTRSWFVSKASEMFLNACLEDQADYDAAVAAWKEHEDNGGKMYTSEEVRKELGL